MTNSNDDLLEVIEAYLVFRGMSASAFGEAATKNRHLVHQMRRGSSVLLPTADRIRKFILDDMKSDKPRPAPRRQSSCAA